MHISNIEKSQWIRPWNKEKFDDLHNRDERFFGLLIKGTLAWLNKNIVLYNKPIKHFIFNTGSSIMYVESNGYKFSWNETTGEDTIYMSRPRCVVELGDISIDTSELTQPNIRGVYERDNNSNIEGFNAEFRRMPIQMSMSLNYVLSNFNESIVLLEELISKLSFQRYFKIVYLGQLIECSIEFPTSHSININKIDMTSTETNQKNINIQINICSSYPAFNELSEISSSSVIGKMSSNIEAYANNDVDYTTDYQRKNIDMTKEDDKLVDSVVYEKENL